MAIGSGTNSYWLLAVGCILCSAVVGAQQSSKQHQDLRLQTVFQSAQAAYTAGRPAEAAAQLEAVLPLSSASTKPALHDLGPQYFPLEELLGLCYASMSQDARAIPFLEAATHLEPQVEEAHTNLAASLLRLGQTDRALEQFRQALALAPQGYTANHNLGEFFIQTDRIAESVPYLQRAQQARPSAYDNGYDLAMAQMLTSQYENARLVVQSLLKVKETGELHNLLGQIDEKDGKFLDAANEFEVAAHMDPSEENLFGWGSELLLHRTYEPAIDIFRTATQRYPNSAREFIGLGMALYARGLYEDAVKALLRAADIDPSDPRCYLFLSRAYDSSPGQAEDVIHRFQQYAQQQPTNALAQFYYAMSVWKGKRSEGATVDLTQVEDLLKKSIALDGKQAQSHFQLGNLYADQHQYERSLPEYLRVIELDPNLADAHYRLGTDYTHLGQKDRAQAEFAIYQKLRSEHLAEVEKERAEVQQFVYSSKSAPQQPGTPQ